LDMIHAGYSHGAGKLCTLASRIMPLFSPGFRIGYSHSAMTNDERMQRESSLIATIRKKLPDFAKACADETEVVLLHQDAFAADYQEDEYLLLGMAIKYAGLRGKEVRVIGNNRSTLGKEDRIH
jgi:hypothetical protein